MLLGTLNGRLPSKYLSAIMNEKILPPTSHQPLITQIHKELADSISQDHSSELVLQYTKHQLIFYLVNVG